VGRRRHKWGKQHHWRLSSYCNIKTNTNVSVVAPTTAANVQLEASSVATPFEQRSLGLELSLGQRFCNKVNFSVLQYAASAGAYSATWVSFSPMRAIPATTLGVEQNPGSVGNTAAGYISMSGCRVQGASAGAGTNADFSGYVLLTAELQSSSRMLAIPNRSM
jgi:hypothetical protein